MPLTGIGFVFNNKTILNILYNNCHNSHCHTTKQTVKYSVLVQHLFVATLSLKRSDMTSFTKTSVSPVTKHKLNLYKKTFGLTDEQSIQLSRQCKYCIHLLRIQFLKAWLRVSCCLWIYCKTYIFREHQNFMIWNCPSLIVAAVI